MTSQFVYAIFIASAILSAVCFIACLACIVHIKPTQPWVGRMAKVMLVIAIIGNWMAYIQSLAFVVSILMALAAYGVYLWYSACGPQRLWLLRRHIARSCKGA